MIPDTFNSKKNKMKYQDSYTKHFVKYLIKIIVAVCATKCFLLIFIFDIFKIPSNSMNPTLLAGDEIIVNKCLFGARIYKTYNFQNKFYQLNCFRTFGIRGIKYNDICVFNKSKQNNKIKFIINNVMCKRCLALPGDIISIQNGIYKNNHYKGQLGFIKQQIELSHKTYTSMPSNVIRSFPKENHFYWTIKKMGPLYIPRKGDRIYLTRKNATIYKMLIEYETDKYLSINWKANKVKLNNNNTPLNN